MIKFISYFLFPSLFMMYMPLYANYQIENDTIPSISQRYIQKARASNRTDSILFYGHQAIIANEDEAAKEPYFVALNVLYEEFSYLNNGDSANFYLELMVSQLSLKQIGSKSKGDVYIVYGRALGEKYEFVEALNYCDSAEALYLEAGDSVLYADALNLKGIINDNMGRRTLALDFYIQASAIYKAYMDDFMYLSMLNNIAIVYKKMGDFETALEYYNKSIITSVLRKDSMRIAISKVNRGLLYKDLKQYDLALDDMIWSKTYLSQAKDAYRYDIALHNLGEVYLAMGDIRKASFYFEKSQSIAKKFKYNSLLVNNKQAFAKIEKTKKNYKKSNQWALDAYSIAKNKDMLEQLIDLSLLIAENHDSLGQFEEALRFYKKYEFYSDRVNDKKNQDETNLLRVRYNVEQKENDIAALEQINRQQTVLAEKERKLNLALVLGVSISVALFVLLFVLFIMQMRLVKKYKNQRQKLKQINIEKDSIMKMVAHDLRAPLNNIRGLMGLIRANQVDDKSDALISMAGESTEILRNRVDSMLDVNFINKGKINLTIKTIEIAQMANKLDRIIQKSYTSKKINFVVDIAEGVTCLADENYLLQILENLCTNALKFSYSNTQVSLAVRTQEGKCLIIVKDEGLGIAENEIPNLFVEGATVSNRPTGDEPTTGWGLVIVKKYVDAMKGKVWCESKVGVGSTFFVSLPQA